MIMWKENKVEAEEMGKKRKKAVVAINEKLKNQSLDVKVQK